MPDVTTEPQGPSLDAASSRIEGLLSKTPEDTPSPTTQPEPSPAPETEQAPAAPADGSEQDDAPADTTDDTTPQPRTFKVKVNGQDIEVTEDEVLKGYSRTEDYTRKTQQLAEARKAFEEQEVAAVRAERAQYGQYLDQLKDAIAKSTPVEPDWVTLRAQVSPDVFAAELLNWQQTQKHLASIDQEKAKVQAQQAADATAGFETYRQQQRAILEEALPEIKDPVKDAAIANELHDYAIAQGFTTEEFRQTTNAKFLLMAHKAMQFDKQKAKAPAIANKIANAMADSAPGSRTTGTPKNELAAAKARLRDSGTVDDGARAIAALLKTG